jgi:hypothetical protein
MPSPGGVSGFWAERNRLERHNLSKWKLIVGEASAPMVMALRRKEKSFDVFFQSLQKIVETSCGRLILQLSLVL